MAYRGSEADVTKTMHLFACILAALLGSAATADAQDQAPKPPTFQVPKGWQAIEPGFVSSARFQIGEGDRVVSVTVTGLKGGGGGLAANINRWRMQIGLESLPEKDALAAAESIKVDGLPGYSVDLTGPSVTGKGARRILATVVTHGDLTWYFKLDGPSSLAATQKSAFAAFLKSVRFEKARSTLPRELRGAWVATEAEYSGKSPPAQIVRQLKVTINEDLITISPLELIQGKFSVAGKPLAFRYKIDGEAKPKEIDLVFKAEDGEHRMLGIYAGDLNELRICWQHDGKMRPREFRTKAEAPQMLLVLKRASK
jgi:uncharacterized protein (TIGR03067 family)